MIIEKEILTDDIPCVILRLVGLATLGNSGNFLESAINALGRENVIIDFRELDYLNSTGIGEIIGICAKQINGGGHLALCNMPRRVEKLMRLAGVITKSFSSQKEARASFAAAAKK